MNNVNYIVITKVEDLPTFDASREVFADSESEKLYVGERLVQLYQPVDNTTFVFPNTVPVYIIDLDYVDIELVRAYLSQYKLVFYGASYDLGLLLFKPVTVDDLQYLARIAYPTWKVLKVAKGEKPYSLNVAVRRLKADYLYNGLDKSELQKAGFVKGAYLSRVQFTYSAMDVIALHYMWCDARIQQARNVMAYKLDCYCLLYSVDIAKNRMLVDTEGVKRELAIANAKLKENLVILNGLNPNSPKQCKEALNIESTDKSTLTIFIATSEDTEKVRLATAIQQQRKLVKRIGMLESYNYEWVESRLNPAGAMTGRYSATGGDLERGINSQQITRDLQYLFHKDTEDTVVIHADFSTAELRAGASIMQDDTMYQELMNGDDLHKKVVSDILMYCEYLQVKKEDRQKGKAVNFGFIFDMGALTFQEYAFVNYGVKFTLDEAKETRAKYKSKYKGVAKYHKYWWDNYKKILGYTPLGRPNLAISGNEAINYPTQGGISECTKLSEHYLVKETEGKALKYMFNIVHDAFYLRVPKAEASYWADILVVCMKRGWSELCKVALLKYKDIPMPVEVEYNDYSSGVAVKIVREL